MQQIQIRGQNKKAPEIENLLIRESKMVQQVDSRWNQVHQSLVIMHQKLMSLGLDPNEITR